MNKKNDIENLKEYQSLFHISPDSDEIWDNIQNQLDVDEVWVRVESELDKSKRRKFIIIYTIVALMIFAIIPMLDYDFIDSNTEQIITENKIIATPENIISLNNEVFHIEENLAVAEEEAIILGKSVLSAPIEGDEKIIPVVSIGKIKPIEINNKIILAKENTQVENKVIEEIDSEILINEIEIPIQQLEVNNSIDELLVDEIQGLPKEKNKKDITLGIYTGASTLIVMNNMTKEAWDENSLVSSKLKPGLSVGVFADFPLKNKFRIRGTLGFQNLKQQYNYYMVSNRVRYVEDIHVFKSVHLGVSSGVKIPIKPNFSFELYSGIYANRILSVNHSISDHDHFHEARIDYTNFTVGFNINSTLSISKGRNNYGIGLKSNKGLINVFKGNEQIPKDMNKTYLNSFGAFVYYGFSF